MRKRGCSTTCCSPGIRNWRHSQWSVGILSRLTAFLLHSTCIGIVLVGLSYSTPVAAVPDDLRSASDSARVRVERALVEEDGAALSSVLAENGAVISPTGEVLKGKLTLKASALLLMMTLGGGDLTLKRHNLNLLDSTGYETGSFTFRKADSGKDDRDWVGRYTVIWEKENGQWKISRALGIL
jgi:ketosteroid isomerase-like protein